MEIPAARSALGNAIAGNSICPGNENIEDSRGWSRASPHRELGPAISRFHATVEPTPRVCRALGHVLASAGYVIDRRRSSRRWFNREPGTDWVPVTRQKSVSEAVRGLPPGHVQNIGRNLLPFVLCRGKQRQTERLET